MLYLDDKVIEFMVPRLQYDKFKEVLCSCLVGRCLKYDLFLFGRELAQLKHKITNKGLSGPSPSQLVLRDWRTLHDMFYTSKAMDCRENGNRKWRA